MYRLKCKIGALAAEARFTHACERREIKEARRIDKKYAGLPPDAETRAGRRRARASSMRLHRVGTVRITARSSQLAYAFLRGKQYLLTERALKVNAEGKILYPPRWDEVERIALRFSDEDEREIKQRFAEWVNAKLTAHDEARLAAIDKAAAAKIEERRAKAKANKEGWKV